MNHIFNCFPKGLLGLFLLVGLSGPGSAQLITTVAGTGTQSFSGDGGAATMAQLNNPVGVAVDGAGNLLIADRNNHRIRRVEAGTGLITTVAGTGTSGFSEDGGAATMAQLNNPRGVVVDGAGNLLIADTGNHRIRRVAAATGLITTVAGTGTSGFSGDGGASTAAQLDSPEGVAVDGAGNLFIADRNNHRIRRVEAGTGLITTLAGTGTEGRSGDGGAATAAQLDSPLGVAVDGAGNLFIADEGNNRIRRVAAATGLITTLAGTGTAGFSGDGGASTAAQLRFPEGVAVDGAGNLFIADTDNNRIRRVAAATGLITTVVGTGTAGFSGDGGAATAAQLNFPVGVAVDGAGNLFIADRRNQRIRRVVNPCTGANLPTVTLVFNNSATVMGTGVPTITVPNTPGQSFQVLGGDSYERVIVIDRINGYEIRQTDSSPTGVFAINRLGLFSITVATAEGCSRTVQGILANP